MSSSSSGAEASPEEMLIAALKPSTADDALRMLADVPLTDKVLTALTAGDAPVTSTSALKFDDDIFLEDDGSELPREDDSAYTFEFWIRSDDGGVNAFISLGGEGQCCGGHFDSGNRIKNFWWGNDLHAQCDEEPNFRWVHLVLRADKQQNKRQLLADGKMIGEDAPGKRVVSESPLFIGGLWAHQLWGNGHLPFKVRSRARARERVRG